jgi:hypothetical protein
MAEAGRQNRNHSCPRAPLPGAAGRYNQRALSASWLCTRRDRHPGLGTLRHVRVVRPGRGAVVPIAGRNRYVGCDVSGVRRRVVIRRVIGSVPAPRPRIPPPGPPKSKAPASAKAAVVVVVMPTTTPTATAARSPAGMASLVARATAVPGTAPKTATRMAAVGMAAVAAEGIRGTRGKRQHAGCQRCRQQSQMDLHDDLLAGTRHRSREENMGRRVDAPPFRQRKRTPSSP